MADEHLPKITIVTPSFNQGAFLERTIQSVLAQDYPNIEHIVIDGGSTDGSVDIIRRYEKHLAYWESTPDNGQSQAINKGFARATGEVFNWLNSDDLLMPSAVRIAVSYLHRYPEIGMVYGDRVRIDAIGNILTVNELTSFHPGEMLYNLFIPQETVFVRRAVWEKAGTLDEHLHYCMDYEMWIRLSRLTSIRHIPFIMGAFRLHNDSKACTGNDAMRKEIAETMLRHFGKTRGKYGKRLYKVRISLRRFFEAKACMAESRQIRRMLRDTRRPDSEVPSPTVAAAISASR